MHTLPAPSVPVIPMIFIVPAYFMHRVCCQLEADRSSDQENDTIGDQPVTWFELRDDKLIPINLLFLLNIITMELNAIIRFKLAYYICRVYN